MESDELVWLAGAPTSFANSTATCSASRTPPGRRPSRQPIVTTVYITQTSTEDAHMLFLSNEGVLCVFHMFSFSISILPGKSSYSMVNQ